MRPQLRFRAVLCSNPCSRVIRMNSSCVNVIKPLLSAPEAIQLFPSAKFVDASWIHFTEKSVRNAANEFALERIPGAVLFDIDCDDLKRTDTALPHMLPSPEKFSDSVSKMGISSSDEIVVYTSKGCYSSARVWWMFRAFGHRAVHVLNGGLPAWKAAGGPIDNSSPPVGQRSRGKFEASFNQNFVASLNDVERIIANGAAQILDARSAGRFTGAEPEPRPGLESGHIPGSLNLPFGELLVPGDWTTFLSPEEIRRKLSAAGIVPGSRVITTCGSGVTAAVLTFGLHLAGLDPSQAPVYDGSWTEWASNSELPKISRNTE